MASRVDKRKEDDEKKNRRKGDRCKRGEEVREKEGRQRLIGVVDGGAESAANEAIERGVLREADGLWRRSKIQRRHDTAR